MCVYVCVSVRCVCVCVLYLLVRVDFWGKFVSGKFEHPNVPLDIVGDETTPSIIPIFQSCRYVSWVSRRSFTQRAWLHAVTDFHTCTYDYKLWPDFGLEMRRSKEA